MRNSKVNLLDKEHKGQREICPKALKIRLSRCNARGIRLREREVGTDQLSEKEERNRFELGLLYSIANLTLNDMNH
jgi:hypothetical protein